MLNEPPCRKLNPHAAARLWNWRALGFLPGDLASRRWIPTCEPLYDALHSLREPRPHHRVLERGVIEVAPPAYNADAPAECVRDRG